MVSAGTVCYDVFDRLTLGPIRVVGHTDAVVTDDMKWHVSQVAQTQDPGSAARALACLALMMRVENEKISDAARGRLMASFAGKTIVTTKALIEAYLESGVTLR